MLLGYHVSHGHSLATSCQEACDILEKMEFTPFLQFFVCGPQNHTFVNMTNEEKIEISKIPHKVIHAAYVSNPWNKAPGAIHNLKQELKLCKELNATGCIIHLGKGAGDDEILRYVMEKTHDIGPVVWLETNSAKQSEYTFETPEKINILIDRIFKINPHPKLGICIDTAHIFACGVALDSAKFTKQWLGKLNRSLPIMFHLNDSIGKLGDGKDIHAPCFHGNIWSAWGPNGHFPPEESGCAEILRYAKKYKSGVVLERHGLPMKELMVIHDLCRKL